jgi:hypothetical protein
MGVKPDFDTRFKVAQHFQCYRERWQGSREGKIPLMPEPVDFVAADDLLRSLAAQPTEPANKATGIVEVKERYNLTSEGGWRPIETLDHKKTVLVFYKNTCGKERIIKAAFYPKYSELADDHNYEGDDAEYNEADDAYYLPEGWYEFIDNWPEYSHIRADISPTHWQPLPNPPAETGE